MAIETVASGGVLRHAALEMSVSTIEGRMYMVLVGELDLCSAPFLLQGFVDIDETLVGDLVLDVGQLSYIDSMGLSILIMQHTKLQKRGSRLIINAPTRKTLRLLEITGLTDIFTVETDSKEVDGCPGQVYRAARGRRYGRPVASTAPPS